MEEESGPHHHKFHRSQSIRLPVDCSKDSSRNLAATPRTVRRRLNLVKFSGPEENTMRRAISRDCVSYSAWSISGSSDHTFDA